MPYVRELYSAYDVATNCSDCMKDVREGRGMQCMIIDQRTQRLPHSYIHLNVSRAHLQILSDNVGRTEEGQD